MVSTAPRLRRAVPVSAVLPQLGRDALPAIAALAQRCLHDTPTESDLDASLFTPGFPVTVRGDPDTGVVASCERDGAAYLRLLMVDPPARRRGLGTALLTAAEADLVGHPSITVGADAPDHLYPGVETDQIEMLCLLEQHRYDRAEANFNMVVDLDRLPPEPSGTHVAEAHERDELDAWTATHWPFWRTEVLRCADRERLMVARDDDGIAAVCCWDHREGPRPLRAHRRAPPDARRRVDPSRDRLGRTDPPLRSDRRGPHPSGVLRVPQDPRLASARCTRTEGCTMLAISGLLRFPPDTRDEMVGVLTALAERTRQDAGCVEYWWAEDLVEPGAFRFFEAWESEETFAAHRDAPYEHEFNDRYLPRLLGADARQYAATEVRSLTG